ncbi:MAG: hypothetical protein ACOYD0_13105 [Candidatus Nanopelagicales bacterium]
MVTDWILGLLASAWEAMIGAIPVPAEDSWISSLPGAVVWVVAQLVQLGNWLPLQIMGNVLGTIAAVWGIAVGIRVGRMALSLFTGGGGV